MTVHELDLSNNRLVILGGEEITQLYDRPCFSNEEREEYFTLSPAETEALQHFRTFKSRLYFVQQLGYFKSKRQFFPLGLHEMEDDIAYILKRYFGDETVNDLSPVDKKTRLNHQNLILELFDYSYCGSREREKLGHKATEAARLCAKPVYVLRQLINYLADERIVLPSYTVLQDVVGKALSDEQSRLIEITQEHLRSADIKALRKLVNDADGLHEITKLKRHPKDFRITEIKREIRRGEQIKALYGTAKKLLPLLEISNENVKQYAGFIDYYTAYKLKQLNEGKAFLYLLCFIYHRFQHIHDNLIASFLYNVRGFIDDAANAAKDQVYEHQIKINRNIKKAGEVLKLLTHDHNNPAMSLQDFQAAAFDIIERDKLAAVGEHLMNNAGFDENAFWWEYIGSIAGSFKLNLRPVIIAVTFAALSKNHPLLKAAEFIQTAFEKGRSLGSYPDDQFPTAFIPAKEKPYIYKEEGNGMVRIMPDRYEFLIYKQLRKEIDAVNVYCPDSVRYRSCEDDLIDYKQWRKDKSTLISKSGLPALKQPVKNHLAELKEVLESRINEVNARIESGENEFITRQDGEGEDWHLQYKPTEDPVNDPFYNELRQIDIGSILQFTNEHCGFIDGFEHVLGRYASKSVDDLTLYASLIAWGTNLGLGRMGEISDISFSTLGNVSNNFIRLETLKDANDRVCNGIATLPVFRLRDVGGTVHSSSDGQKFETRIHTVNARHSPKYFGLKKGVVSLSLVANDVPVNARIIGANEHESHYVFDILYNNTTDIRPDIHSTDMHGINQINFGILHIFGYQFAPRYVSVQDKIRTSLHGFKNPGQYNGLIRPTRKINEQLIIDEWDNCQRVFLSLAQKTTTQNIIVKKMSSYPGSNRIKKALWEYDNIIKSIYMLDYIDSPVLRRNVQKVLNRGENYHKLRRAVSYANFGKLRFKTEHEQQIWGECARLIANCIIFYNASILSHLIEHKDSIDDNQAVALLEKISLIAWQHVNFYGRYEFCKRLKPIDIDGIIKELTGWEVKENMAA